MKKQWYIIKKKKDRRWGAYEIQGKPEIKKGCEIRGPFKSLVKCMMEANKE